LNDFFLAPKLHLTTNSLAIQAYKISKDIEPGDTDFQTATKIGDKPIHMTQNMATQQKQNYAYNKLWLINSQPIWKLVNIKMQQVNLNI
jgi:hypothetical protein